MPLPALLVPALIGGLATAMTSLVGRVLIALGVSFATFTGVSLLFSSLLTDVQSSMNSLPADALAFLAYMWVDKAITLIFSAFTAALTLKLGASGTVTRMILKK
jgi:hypothetical protein